MNKKQAYKEALARHDDPRYTFEHYDNYRWFPIYNMSTDDLRELRNEYKQELKQNDNSYKITDRAIVLATPHGSILKSYYTEVACIYDGIFYKLWEGFSSTTMKHINTYRIQNNMPALSKHDWIMMPTTTIIEVETNED